MTRPRTWKTIPKITAGQVLLWTIIIEAAPATWTATRSPALPGRRQPVWDEHPRGIRTTAADDLENPVITSVRGGSASVTGYTDLTELAEDGSTV